MNTTCAKVLAFTTSSTLMTGLVFPIRELRDQPYLPISNTPTPQPDQPHTPHGGNSPVELSVSNDFVASGAWSNVSAQTISMSSDVTWLLPSSGTRLQHDLWIATRLRQVGINVIVQLPSPKLGDCADVRPG